MRWVLLDLIWQYCHESPTMLKYVLEVDGRLMNVDGQCKFRRGPKQGFAAVLLTD
jgi:hypothetical protein